MEKRTLKNLKLIIYALKVFISAVTISAPFGMCFSLDKWSLCNFVQFFRATIGGVLDVHVPSGG